MRQLGFQSKSKLQYPSDLMHIQIDYRLTGSGWAECTLSSDGQTCLLTASYLSDALRSLVLAANGVLAGFSALTFSFDEEPGEFRWVITAQRPNEIQVEVLQFSELWGGRPNAEGSSVYMSSCRPIVFAKAVANAAKRVLDTVKAGTSKNGTSIRSRWLNTPT